MGIEVVSQSDKAVEPIVEAVEKAVEAKDVPAVELDEKSDIEAKAEIEKPAESEPVEKEKEDLEESDEAEDDDSEDESKEAAELEATPKKKSGFQKRINKLNAKIQAEKEQAEYWRKEAQKGQQNSDNEEQPIEAASEDLEPIDEDFEEYSDYNKAWNRWDNRQIQKELAAEARNQAVRAKVQESVAKHNERMAAYDKGNPDFQEAQDDFYSDNGDDYQISMALRESIVESDNGPAILHELFKNPGEFDRLNTLGPSAAARAIGRLEGKLEVSNPGSVEPKNKTTKTPPPISTVRSRKASGPKDISNPNLSQKEYETLRDQQEKAL